MSAQRVYGVLFAPLPLESKRTFQISCENTLKDSFWLQPRCHFKVWLSPSPPSQLEALQSHPSLQYQAPGNSPCCVSTRDPLCFSCIGAESRKFWQCHGCRERYTKAWWLEEDHGSPPWMSAVSGEFWQHHNHRECYWHSCVPGSIQVAELQTPAGRNEGWVRSCRNGTDHRLWPDVLLTEVWGHGVATERAFPAGRLWLQPFQDAIGKALRKVLLKVWYAFELEVWLI